MKTANNLLSKSISNIYHYKDQALSFEDYLMCKEAPTYLQPYNGNGVHLLVLDKTKGYTLPAPHFRNGSSRYVEAKSVISSLFLFAKLAVLSSFFSVSIILGIYNFELPLIRRFLSFQVAPNKNVSYGTVATYF